MEYIEVTLSDVEQANAIAHEVLGRTLDELPPQTRKLLELIQCLVQRDCQQQRIEQDDYRFSRKAVREFTNWSDGQLKIHCKRLEELEYLLVHRGGRGQSFVYELLYSGDASSEQPHMMGLMDVKKLNQHQYDKKKSGQTVEKSAPSQGQVRPKSGGSQAEEMSKNLDKTSPKRTDTTEAAENAPPESRKINGRSYRTGNGMEQAAPSLVAKASAATADWSA